MKLPAIVSDLAVALGFLTIIPVPVRLFPEGTSFGRSFSWFPLVGLIIGGILSGAALLSGGLLPDQVLAALLVALWAAVTGGLHLDGLMDSSDGMFCAKSPEERLVVMRDSRVGAFGVLGALVVLLLKFASLGALAGGGDVFVLIPALVAAPVLARWAMTFAVVAFPYHRHGDTLGDAFTREAGARQMLPATATALFVLGGLVFYVGLLPVVSAGIGAVVATCLVAGFALAKLGGLTGDVYGAIGEVVEVVVLVVFSAFVFAAVGAP